MYFKVIFENKQNQPIDFLYKCNNSVISKKWLAKIKHLKNLPHDLSDSSTHHKFPLHKSYKKIKNKYKLDYTPPKKIDQTALNDLHNIFELISQSKNDHGVEMRAFHHSIHQHEIGYRSRNRHYYDVGWGDKEGPLTTHMRLNHAYSDHMKKGNIYLRWAELGKLPSAYFHDQEPNNVDRFCELAKPHETFRAKFTIVLKDRVIQEFDDRFLKWFKNYKKQWFTKYKIDSWNPRDEQSGVLLAEIIQGISKIDLIKKEKLVFKRIEFLS